MNDFWARKLGGGQAPPPHVQPTPQPGPAYGQPGAWWQGSPVAPHAQQQVPPEAYQQQVPPQQLTMQQLKAMRADEMSQEQMEQLALLELQGDKYNTFCPNCNSPDFLPAGTRIGSQKMPVDKCFHCGSSGALTQSPEPAISGRGKSPGHQTRQTVAGGQGNYGAHHSQLPSQYIPRV